MDTVHFPTSSFDAFLRATGAGYKVPESVKALEIPVSEAIRAVTAYATEAARESVVTELATKFIRNYAPNDSSVDQSGQRKKRIISGQPFGFLNENLPGKYLQAHVDFKGHIEDCANAIALAKNAMDFLVQCDEKALVSIRRRDTSMTDVFMKASGAKIRYRDDLYREKQPEQPWAFDRTREHWQSNVVAQLAWQREQAKAGLGLNKVA